MKNIAYQRISDLAPEERPRERLAARGVTVLSDIELLSLMLGSGNGNKGVGRLALEILAVMDGREGIPNLEELMSIEGIGPARASMLSASFEYVRRRLRPANRRISQPVDVLPLVTHWADRPQEYFLVISLNGAHEVLRLRVVSQGTLDRTIVHPREVFVDPLADRAAAIICAHNHPSGNTEPSNEDKNLTQRLSQAGDLLGIPLLDHVIFTLEGYYSFLENDAL